MSQVKNIFVYSGASMSNIWAKRFCLHKFTKTGFNIIFLDAARIFHSEIEIKKRASGAYNFLYSPSNTQRIASFTELKHIVKGLNGSDIVWVANRNKLNTNFQNHDIKIFNK